MYRPPRTAGWRPAAELERVAPEESVASLVRSKRDRPVLRFELIGLKCPADTIVPSRCSTVIDLIQ